MSIQPASQEPGCPRHELASSSVPKTLARQTLLKLVLQALAQSHGAMQHAIKHGEPYIPRPRRNEVEKDARASGMVHLDLPDRDAVCSLIQCRPEVCCRFPGQVDTDGDWGGRWKTSRCTRSSHRLHYDNVANTRHGCCPCPWWRRLGRGGGVLCGPLAAGGST